MSVSRPVVAVAPSITLATLVAFAGIFTPPVTAQEAPPRHSLDAGARALQFQVRGNFVLSDFQGAVLSAKYHLRDDAAIRFGLRARARSQESDQSSTRVIGADSVGDMLQSESASDDVNYTIGLESQYVVYANVQDPIKLFAGAGPFIEYMRAAFEETNTAGDPNESGLIRDMRRTRSTVAGGITAVLGGEWFVTRYISLSAEYGLALGYVRAEEEVRTEAIRNRIETTTVVRIIRAWDLRPSGVRFGLSLYL